MGEDTERVSIETLRNITKHYVGEISAYRKVSEAIDELAILRKEVSRLPHERIPFKMSEAFDRAGLLKAEYVWDNELQTFKKEATDETATADTNTTQHNTTCS